MWAILLFIVAPIVELYVFVQAANAFGFGRALVAMIAITLVGVWIVKREGFASGAGSPSWPAPASRCRRRSPTARSILLAGLLLVAPGFISDIFGVLLLLPPVRALVRPLLIRRYTVRGRVIKATYGGDVYDTTEHTEPHELDE